MPIPRLLSSGAFRFALLLALVFALGSAALLAVVEHEIDEYTAEAVRDGVESELSILLGEEAELGRAELIRAVARHQRAMREGQLGYLLVDSHRHVLAGSLPVSAASPGWHALHLRGSPAEGGGDHCCDRRLIAKGVVLGDGATLEVASDSGDLADLRDGLIASTVAFGALICFLVLAGGCLVGGVFVRRLDHVNRAIDRIVAGRFSERLPPIGMGPEFVRLSANLNAMLDRIETLMDGLRQVSTDIAHDLRTPLTRLRQRLEGLHAARGAVRDDEVEGALRQTDQILAIFGALLRIGSLESGAARASFAKVDLGEVACRIGAAYAPEVEDGGRVLATRVEPGVVVLGDAELLAQAAANLVGNAVAHTPSGTRIALRVEAGPSEARIVVADDGPGIPFDERDRVLRRFYRLDRSRSTPGAGLGLSLVAAIAALHEGTLVLDEASPGLRATIAVPLEPGGERLTHRSDTRRGTE